MEISHPFFNSIFLGATIIALVAFASMLFKKKEKHVFDPKDKVRIALSCEHFRILTPNVSCSCKAYLHNRRVTRNWPFSCQKSGPPRSPHNNCRPLTLQTPVCPNRNPVLHHLSFPKNPLRIRRLNGSNSIHQSPPKRRR